MPGVGDPKVSTSDYPADLYVALHAGHPGDVEHYLRACSGAGSVLELGCGDGRILAPLAERTGEVVGLEIDEGQLALAKARIAACEAADRIRLEAGDMRDFDLGARFDAIIVPFGGLYCLLSEADLRNCLARVFAHLAPGGRLLADVWAADDFHANYSPDECEPGWVDRAGTIEVGEHTYEVLERSEWDRATQRLDAHYLHVRVGTEDSIETVLRQRYVLQPQLAEMLAELGFRDIGFTGDFAGNPYDSESELMVVEARR